MLLVSILGVSQFNLLLGGRRSLQILRPVVLLD